jgi:hypothetical protein
MKRTSGPGDDGMAVWRLTTDNRAFRPKIEVPFDRVCLRILMGDLQLLKFRERTTYVNLPANVQIMINFLGFFNKNPLANLSLSR